MTGWSALDRTELKYWYRPPEQAPSESMRTTAIKVFPSARIEMSFSFGPIVLLVSVPSTVPDKKQV